MPLLFGPLPGQSGGVSIFVPSEPQRQVSRRQRRPAREQHHLLIDRCRTGPTALLLAAPDNGDAFAWQANRGWIRLLAHVLASRLDGQLASGLPPESSRLTAARAQRLVSLPVRSALARQWRELLAQAAGPSVGRNPAVPICRDRIAAAAADLRAMLDALSTRLPVPARGVAAANRLLTDGAGPIYNRSSTTDLVDAVRQVVELLDPATSLSLAR